MGGKRLLRPPSASVQRELLRILAGDTAPPSNPHALFATSSVFNTEIPSNVPLDPTSDARVRAFATQIRDEQGQGHPPWPGTGSATYYTVTRHQPLVHVVLATGPWGARLARVFAAGVPIPAGAAVGSGSDGHMIIYQPSTDRLWELFQARRSTKGWVASWGGAISPVTASPGFYTPSSWDGPAGPGQSNWGATASGISEAAGLVRIDELRAGRIDHAIAIDIPNPCATVFAWPAQRTDGRDQARATCLPEGAHLRLNPALDLSKLHLSRFARVVAIAAQKYGMVVRDRDFGAVQVDLETPPARALSPDRDRPPYTGPAGLFGGLEPWQVLANFPWSALELIRMRLCTRAPCLQ